VIGPAILVNMAMLDRFPRSPCHRQESRAVKEAAQGSEAPRLVRATDPLEVAAGLLADAVGELDRVRGAARLAIPGGSVLAALGPARKRLGKAWARVLLTWVDERCVPFAHAESNRGAAYRAGYLDASHAPARELPLFLDGERGEDAVARVESGLTEIFDGALDVLLLGMGEDGHVASLFPGWSAPAGARAAFVASSSKPPPRRVTLTRSMLATARCSILVAAGEPKRAALVQLLGGDPGLPAQGLPDLTVVTDLDLRKAT
jgi:6-phosphogluconolactonase